MLVAKELRAPAAAPGTSLDLLERFVQWEHCTNTQISYVIGKSPEYVRQIRAQLHKPNPMVKWKGSVIAEFQAWANERAEQIPNMTLPEIVATFDGTISINSVRNSLKNLGIQWKKTEVASATKFSRPWHDIDWRLPNPILAKIWRYPSMCQSRCRYRKPKSSYNWLIDWQLLESKKAEEWFVKNPRIDRLPGVK